MDFDVDVLKEHFGSSLMSLNLVTLRRLFKNDVMEIVLIRERILYDKINEFDASMKHNDRVVFDNLRKENAYLRKYLLAKSSAFRELNLKECEIFKLKKLVNLTCGFLDVVKNEKSVLRGKLTRLEFVHSKCGGN